MGFVRERSRWEEGEALYTRCTLVRQLARLHITKQYRSHFCYTDLSRIHLSSVSPPLCVCSIVLLL